MLEADALRALQLWCLLQAPQGRRHGGGGDDWRARGGAQTAGIDTEVVGHDEHRAGGVAAEGTRHKAGVLRPVNVHEFALGQAGEVLAQVVLRDERWQAIGSRAHCRPHLRLDPVTVRAHLLHEHVRRERLGHELAEHAERQGHTDTPEGGEEQGAKAEDLGGQLARVDLVMPCHDVDLITLVAGHLRLLRHVAVGVEDVGR
mmetsp:Transcript_25442/g.64695  ORF Transcript_25442/g.64695 Transcript_25442/m.64695 type:complete len:202 (+) Transcript_25442:1049-1654(+)